MSNSTTIALIKKIGGGGGGGGAVNSVNGKTGAVVLDAEDVGALPDDTPLFSGDYDDLTNKPTIPSIEGLATETFVNDAISAAIGDAIGGSY